MTTTYLFASGNKTESDYIKQQLWMALERVFPNRNGWTFFRLNSYHLPIVKNEFDSSGKIFTDEEAVAAQQDFLRAGDDEIRRIVTTETATVN